MGVDVVANAGVAEGQHGGIEFAAQVLGERMHRAAILTQAVQQDEHRPADRRDGAVLLQARELPPAFTDRPAHDGALARVDDPPVGAGRVALQPPFVTHERVGPFEGLTRAAQRLEQGGIPGAHVVVGRNRLGGLRRPSRGQGHRATQQEAVAATAGGVQRNSFHPRFSSSATTRRTASSCARLATSVASAVCTTSISSRPSVTTR